MPWLAVAQRSWDRELAQAQYDRVDIETAWNTVTGDLLNPAPPAPRGLDFG